MIARIIGYISVVHHVSFPPVVWVLVHQMDVFGCSDHSLVVITISMYIYLVSLFYHYFVADLFSL